jgi:ABC-type sugar transport system permease subunit
MVKKRQIVQAIAGTVWRFLFAPLNFILALIDPLLTPCLPHPHAASLLVTVCEIWKSSPDTFLLSSRSSSTAYAARRSMVLLGAISGRP